MSRYPKEYEIEDRKAFRAERREARLRAKRSKMRQSGRGLKTLTLPILKEKAKNSEATNE